MHRLVVKHRFLHRVAAKLQFHGVTAVDFRLFLSERRAVSECSEYRARDSPRRLLNAVGHSLHRIGCRSLRCRDVLGDRIVRGILDSLDRRSNFAAALVRCLFKCIRNASDIVSGDLLRRLLDIFGRVRDRFLSGLGCLGKCLLNRLGRIRDRFLNCLRSFRCSLLNGLGYLVECFLKRFRRIRNHFFCCLGRLRCGLLNGLGNLVECFLYRLGCIRDCFFNCLRSFRCGLLDGLGDLVERFLYRLGNLFGRRLGNLRDLLFHNLRCRFRRLLNRLLFPASEQGGDQEIIVASGRLRFLCRSFFLLYFLRCRLALRRCGFRHGLGLGRLGCCLAVSSGEQCREDIGIGRCAVLLDRLLGFCCLRDFLNRLRCLFRNLGNFFGRLFRNLGNFLSCLSDLFRHRLDNLFRRCLCRFRNDLRSFLRNLGNFLGRLGNLFRHRLCDLFHSLGDLRRCRLKDRFGLFQCLSGRCKFFHRLFDRCELFRSLSSRFFDNLVERYELLRLRLDQCLLRYRCERFRDRLLGDRLIRCCRLNLGRDLRSLDARLAVHTERLDIVGQLRRRLKQPSVHLRHAHIILREGRDVLLVLLQTVGNVLFPVALLVNHLALVHDGLGVVILVSQSRAEYEEHHEPEPKKHQAGFLVLQHIDLYDVKCREHAYHKRCHGEAHSDDREHTHFSAVHQFLIAIGDDLFLEHLLQAASGNRRNRNRKHRIFRDDLLGSLANTVGASAPALLGKCRCTRVVLLRGLLLHLVEHRLATVFRGKCCRCSGGSRGTCGSLRRLLRGFLHRVGNLVNGLRGVGLGFLNRLRDIVLNIVFYIINGSLRFLDRFSRDFLGFRDGLFRNGLDNRFLDRRLRNNRLRYIGRTAVRRCVSVVRADGIRLLDRISRAVQQTALSEKLCERLLLRRCLLLGSLVLDHLNTRLRRDRTGHLFFRVRCVLALADLTDKIHLLLERRTVLGHLGDLPVGLLRRIELVELERIGCGLGSFLDHFRNGLFIRSACGILLRIVIRRTDQRPVDRLAVGFLLRCPALLAGSATLRLAVAGSLLRVVVLKRTRIGLVGSGQGT